MLCLKVDLRVTTLGLARALQASSGVQVGVTQDPQGSFPAGQPLLFVINYQRRLIQKDFKRYNLQWLGSPQNGDSGLVRGVESLIRRPCGCVRQIPQGSFPAGQPLLFLLYCLLCTLLSFQPESCCLPHISQLAHFPYTGTGILWSYLRALSVPEFPDGVAVVHEPHQHDGCCRAGPSPSVEQATPHLIAQRTSMRVSSRPRMQCDISSGFCASERTFSKQYQPQFVTQCR